MPFLLAHPNTVEPIYDSSNGDAFGLFRSIAVADDNSAAIMPGMIIRKSSGTAVLADNGTSSKGVLGIVAGIESSGANGDEILKTRDGYLPASTAGVITYTPLNVLRAIRINLVSSVSYTNDAAIVGDYFDLTQSILGTDAVTIDQGPLASVVLSGQNAASTNKLFEVTRVLYKTTDPSLGGAIRVEAIPVAAALETP